MRKPKNHIIRGNRLCIAGSVIIYYPAGLKSKFHCPVYALDSECRWPILEAIYHTANNNHEGLELVQRFEAWLRKQLADRVQLPPERPSFDPYVLTPNR